MSQTFDFTAAMEDLVRHIALHCPRLKHIRAEQVMVSYLRTRTPGVNGVYASVHPLRFEGGALSTVHRGRTYTMPRVVHEGREILYIVYFALPRFLDLDFQTKLTTVFHELYHISPKFDGDIRRFRGKYYAHGHSRKAYNDRALALAKEYLSAPGAEERTAFLRMSFRELSRDLGAVTGTRVRAPRPRPDTQRR